MDFVGNLLWFVLGGFAMCLEWAVLGICFALTGIGIPFAVAAFRIAGYAAFPFGRELIEVELLGEQRVPGTGLANALWVICAGFWLALGHAIVGIVLCMTVIGIPFGLAHFKLSQACFAPLGKRIVTRQMAAAARYHYHNAMMQQRHAQMMPGMVMQRPPVLMPQPVATSAPGPLKFCHACGMKVHFTATNCPICNAVQRPV
jgi:uncharacterized membrane protein YccF (DUF307 family)